MDKIKNPIKKGDIIFAGIILFLSVLFLCMQFLLICVHHKSIYKNHETIICLPKEVYVEIIGNQENEIDN